MEAGREEKETGLWARVPVKHSRNSCNLVKSLSSTVFVPGLSVTGTFWNWEQWFHTGYGITKFLFCQVKSLKKNPCTTPLFRKMKDILIPGKARRLNLQDEGSALHLINLDWWKTRYLVLIFLCHHGLVPVLQSGVGEQCIQIILSSLTLCRREWGTTTRMSCTPTEGWWDQSMALCASASIPPIPRYSSISLLVQPHSICSEYLDSFLGICTYSYPIMPE